MQERKKDHSHVVFGLSTQYLSALLAAGAQYFASVLRAHPLAESMHFLAFADIRFESRSHLLHLPGEILIHMPIYRPSNIRQICVCNFSAFRKTPF